MSINNMEDLLGGHSWVGISSLIGGVWHIQTRPFFRLTLKQDLSPLLSEVLHGQVKLIYLTVYQL